MNCVQTKIDGIWTIRTHIKPIPLLESFNDERSPYVTFVSDSPKKLQTIDVDEVSEW